MKLYRIEIKGKAYLAVSVMANSQEEAIADIIKSEGISREDIISIKES